MQIFVLGGKRPDLAAIESALRLGEVEIIGAPAGPDPSAPGECRYAFAGWMLDATTRDLVSFDSRRVDLTSSEFDLLMTFVRRPGQALSRAVLLAALRGRTWTYFDRSIDTLVARLRKKIDAGPCRPPLIRSVRGVGYVFCANVSHASAADRTTAA